MQLDARRSAENLAMADLILAGRRSQSAGLFETVAVITEGETKRRKAVQNVNQHEARAVHAALEGVLCIGDRYADTAAEPDAHHVFVRATHAPLSKRGNR